MLKKLVFVFLLLHQTCFAEKIAVVDVQNILDHSLALKDLSAQAEKRMQGLQDESNQKLQELKKEEESLLQSKGKVPLSDTKKKSAAFENKIQDAKKYAQSQKTKLDKAYSNGIMQINNVITQIIEDICKAKGCTVVLPTSQLLYANPDLNITQEVLDKLNTTISNIKLDF